MLKLFFALLIASTLQQYEAGRVKTSTIKPEVALIDQIQSTFTEIKQVLKAYSTEQIAKFNLQSDDLLQLVSVLRELHAQTLPMVEILMGSGSECDSYLNKVRIDDSDLQNITNFNINFENKAVNNMNVQEAITNTINTFESLTKDVNEMIVAALSRTQESFEDIFTNLVTTKDLSDLLKEKESAKPVSQDVIDLYFRNVNLTLEETEHELDEKIRERQEGLRINEQTKSRLIRNFTTVDQYDKDILYNQFQCKVTELKRDDDVCKEYLSENDIDTLHKSLYVMKKELLDFTSGNNMLTQNPQNRQILESLLNRIKGTISKIQKFYQVQQQRETELFQEVRAALKSKQFGEIRKLDTSYIKNQMETKKIVKEMYEEMLDRNAILEKIKLIEDVGTAFAGIEATFMAEADYFNSRGQNLPAGMDRELQDVNRKLILNRFKTNFRQDTSFFSVSTSRYIHDLYLVRDRYAFEVIENIINEIDGPGFLIGTNRYMADTVLFLDLNLQLILRTECNLLIYGDWFTSINLKRFFRKIDSYIDLVKLKFPNDKHVIDRSNVLNGLIWYYMNQDPGVSNETACKTLETLHRIQIDS